MLKRIQVLPVLYTLHCNILSLFCDKVAGLVVKQEATAVEYLDCSKASEIVSHNILISKLGK